MTRLSVDDVKKANVEIMENLGKLAHFNKLYEGKVYAEIDYRDGKVCGSMIEVTRTHRVKY